MSRLGGKRAIVTGAGNGIGREISLRLAGEGVRVALADIDEDAAGAVASEIGDLGGETLVYRVDVTSESEVEGLVARVVEEWDGLDVMINNAGVGIAADAPGTSLEDWQFVMDVSLKGTFLGIKHAVPAMRESGGGSIVNMSSIAAMVGLKDRAAYCAAKGGVLALTRAAAIDHVEEGIRVNCIAPGTVETPWVDRITADYDDPAGVKETMKSRQPHGRFVQPEEIAAMAAYLASDEAGSVVGACMVVDGGMTAR